MDQLKKSRAMVVAGGMLVMLTQFSISSNCFSLFIIPICKDLNFMRGQFSVAQSMLALGGVCAALFSGKVFNRFGLLRVIRISAVFAVLVYFLQSAASTVLSFCVINYLLGFFNSFSTYVPISLLISDWFSERKNTVTGIAMMGSGFGTSIFNSLGSGLILSFGWRIAMRILALVMALFILTADFLLLKEAPQRLKRSSASEINVTAVSREAPFFTGKNIPVAVMCAAVSMAGGVLVYTAQPHLQDIGYSQTYAAHLFSIAMIVMAAGKILHGMIIDRFGVRVSNTAIVLTASLGLTGLLAYRGIFSAILVCVGMLFITSLNVVGAPALAEALGGAENKKFFLGKISACINGGYMLAPFIYGAIYDRAGSYRLMYAVSIILLFLSLPWIWRSLPAKKGA